MLERGQEPIGNQLGRVGFVVVDQDGELVAPESGQGVLGARRRLQSGAYLA